MTSITPHHRWRMDSAKWFLMGVCDVIPGISGGTIAFITGIYERLIDALHGFNMVALRHLLAGRLGDARTTIDGWFLVRLFGGILVAIVSVAHLVQHLLETAPIAVWGFFWWLIAMSSVMLLSREIAAVRRRGERLHRSTWWWMAVGIAIGRWVTLLPLMQASGDLWWFFASGMIAISAMILPGISGSYILVILGTYVDILAALTDTISHLQAVVRSMDWAALWSPSMSIIAVFMGGAVIGLLAFAKLLHRIKQHYHTTLVVLMTWFMIGALGKVRPRQTVVSTYVDRHGDIQTLQTALSRPASSGDALRWAGMMLVGMILIGVVWWWQR